MIIELVKNNEIKIDRNILKVDANTSIEKYIELGGFVFIII